MTTLPDAFLRRMAEQLGAEYPAFLDSYAQPPTRALRVNTLRAGAEALARKYIDSPVAWERDGRYVPDGAKPGADILHFCGAYYLQDASAMAPANALSARAGERVLDLCASPGGKSGQLARDAGETGFLLANEIERPRAEVLAGNLERLGIANAYVTNLRPAQLAVRLPGFFDAVLADAPCSGEGMFRRDEEARRQWREGSPEGCAARQTEILAEAAKLVRPGGRLVYSTCTFNSTENEDVVAAFLAGHPDFCAEEFALAGVGASRNGMLRLWPHKIPGEGQFMAKLRRMGEGTAINPAARPPETKETALLDGILAALPPGRARVVGGMLCLLPPSAPDPEDVCTPGQLLRAGIPLCRADKGYAKPEHALAMAAPACARLREELSDAQARAFLAGETVSLSSVPGWTLMTYRGLPLGWGKCVDGVMKNHIPKGLRFRAQ